MGCVCVCVSMLDRGRGAAPGPAWTGAGRQGSAVAAPGPTPRCWLKGLLHPSAAHAAPLPALPPWVRGSPFKYSLAAPSSPRWVAAGLSHCSGEQLAPVHGGSSAGTAAPSVWPGLSVQLALHFPWFLSILAILVCGRCCLWPATPPGRSPH